MLVDWRGHLTSCHSVFIFAPSGNRDNFFFDGSPLTKTDTRIRSIPFPTRRPTFTEVQRVAKWLATAECESSEARASAAAERARLDALMTAAEREAAAEAKQKKDAETARIAAKARELELKRAPVIDLLVNAVQASSLTDVQQLYTQRYKRPPLAQPLLLLACSLNRPVEWLELLTQHGELVDECNVGHGMRTALHQYVYHPPTHSVIIRNE